MKKIGIMCLALLLSIATSAQERKVEMSLQQAIGIALNDNPTIQIANLEIERQDYVRRETIGNLLPNVSVDGSYSRNIMKQKLGGKISIQGNNSIAAAAQLSIPLFAPGVYNTLKMNKEEMYAAVEAARGSKITLINEVKKAYYNILLAQQSLVVLYASEKTISETVENTRVMNKNAMASEYDLLTAEVQLSNLKPTIIQTETSIQVGKLMLKMLLSLPEDVDVLLMGSLDEFVGQVYAMGTTMITDVSNNTDLKSLELQERVLGAQFKALRSQRLPTLAAFGSFNISGEDMPDMSNMFGGGTSGVTPSSSGTDFIWQKPLAVGVRLSVPIFSGLSNVNREKQLKNNIAQLKVQRQYLEQGKTVELKSAISDIFTAREQMVANQKTVDQASKAYDISNTRYKAGVGTILELNSAELSLTQAKLNYTQASYNYLAAQADYETIIGSEK